MSTKQTNQELTIKELSEKLKLDYLTTSGLVKAGVQLGLIKDVGRRSTSANGRGKPSTVYSVPNKFAISFTLDAGEVKS